MRMKIVNRAGMAPTMNIHRHDSGVTVNILPTIAISKNPTLAAAPIIPAISGRSFSGQHSITRATPSAHSPPIPKAARNRNAPRCHADCAK